MMGKLRGGVRARGEFLMLIRNERSYTILEPPGEEDKEDTGDDEDDIGSSPGDCRLLVGMGMLCAPEPDIV